MYCVREASRREVFTQLQNWAHLTQSFYLEPPRMSSGNFNCLGSDQFMPESTVHHAARRCSF
jgi:hypothetical protein